MDRNWSISIFFKYVLIFFLPLYLVIGPLPSYTSVLIHTGVGGGPFGNYDNSSYMLAPFLALIFTLPAALFDYAAHHRPEGRPIGRLLVLAFIVLNPLVQLLLVSIAISPLIMTPQMNISFYNNIFQSFSIAIMANTWSLPLMVVIPFFLRQVRSFKHEEKTVDSQGKQGFARGFSKYDAFAILLGLSIFVVPIVMTNSSYLYYGNYSPRTLTLVLVSGGSLLQIDSPGVNMMLTFTTENLSSFILLPLPVGLYMLFIYNVFEYLKNKTSQQRCLVTGLLAFFSAPLISYIIAPSAYGTTPLYVPSPIILLVAIAIIWRVEPIDAGDKIWDGPVRKPWYKSREAVPSDEGGDEAAAPASQPSSQNHGGGKKQKQQYDWDHRADDVFAGEPDNEEH